MAAVEIQHPLTFKVQHSLFGKNFLAPPPEGLMSNKSQQQPGFPNRCDGGYPSILVIQAFITERWTRGNVPAQAAPSATAKVQVSGRLSTKSAKLRCLGLTYMEPT